MEWIFASNFLPICVFIMTAYHVHQPEYMYSALQRSNIHAHITIKEIWGTEHISCTCGQYDFLDHCSKIHSTGSCQTLRSQTKLRITKGNMPHTMFAILQTTGHEWQRRVFKATTNLIESLVHILSFHQPLSVFQSVQIPNNFLQKNKYKSDSCNYPLVIY